MTLTETSVAETIPDAQDLFSIQLPDGSLPALTEGQSVNEFYEIFEADFAARVAAWQQAEPTPEREQWLRERLEELLWQAKERVLPAEGVADPGDVALPPISYHAVDILDPDGHGGRGSLFALVPENGPEPQGDVVVLRDGDLVVDAIPKQTLNAVADAAVALYAELAPTEENDENPPDLFRELDKTAGALPAMKASWLHRLAGRSSTPEVIPERRVEKVRTELGRLASEALVEAGRLIEVEMPRLRRLMAMTATLAVNTASLAMSVTPVPKSPGIHERVAYKETVPAYADPLLDGESTKDGYRILNSENHSTSARGRSFTSRSE